jgi:hypothetical protein
MYAGREHLEGTESSGGGSSVSRVGDPFASISRII